MPARRAAKAPAPKKSAEVELKLELAVDPRSLIQPLASEPPVSSLRPARSGASNTSSARPGAPPQSARAARTSLAPRGPAGGPLAVDDLAFDARLLADYGDPPKHWLLSPLYAWHVLRRQRELKHALVVRRDEATRATTELEDSLVAFAERVRPIAEQKQIETYATVLADARHAEELLRSRDRVLAADQDAQNARLTAVDARLSKLEAELAKAQADERAIVAEISTAQGALGREDAKLKRAESELRAAQREGIGTGE